MINQHFRHYISYRPKLEYIYDRIVTRKPSPVNSGSNNPSSNYTFINKGALASEVSNYIEDILFDVKELLDNTKMDLSAQPLYNKYLEANKMQHSHEKYELLERLQHSISDVEGNIKLETLQLLEELYADWQRLEKVFNNTAVRLLNDEFETGDIKEKEIKLDELNKTLLKNKKKSDDELVTLYANDDLLSSEFLRVQQDNTDIGNLIEDIENISYAKIDVCNIISLRYNTTNQLLSDISKKINNISQNILDNHLIYVLQYILDNISPFDINTVTIQIKSILSLLRLSLDEKIKECMSIKSKMDIVSKDTTKDYIAENFETSFLYRNKVSSKISHYLEKFPDNSPAILDGVLETITDGMIKAEDNYVNQLSNIERITDTDIDYKTQLWDSIQKKELTRIMINILSDLLKYINLSGIPSQENTYTWLVSFCHAYGYDLTYDSESGSNTSVTF